MIDSTALKEALINAIVHNDYSYGNSPVIELYSDRIEITSDCGLPHGLSQDEFLRGVTAPRNKELIRVFKDVELIENIGSGVLRILKAYDKNCFVFMQNFLRVSFKYRENEFWKDTATEKSSKKSVTEDLLLSLCKEEKSLKEIVEYFGYKDLYKFKNRYINPLIEQNKLEMTIPNEPKNRNQKYATKK